MIVIYHATEQGATHVAKHSSSRHSCGSVERYVHMAIKFLPTEHISSCLFDFFRTGGMYASQRTPRLEFNAGGDQIHDTRSKTTPSQSSTRRRHIPPSLPFELKFLADEVAKIDRASREQNQPKRDKRNKTPALRLCCRESMH